MSAMTKRIHTVKGAIEIDALGSFLPHEQLFTEFRDGSGGNRSQCIILQGLLLSSRHGCVQ